MDYKPPKTTQHNEQNMHPNNHLENKHHNNQEEHHDHHSMMIQDFKKRFFISLIIMLPILLLSPMIQMFINHDWSFTGDSIILFALSTLLLFYGGKPFLSGAIDELRKKEPAMMTLIAFAISVAYIYSSLTVFILSGNDFFWELATLIVIMLLGHWLK